MLDLDLWWSHFSDLKPLWNKQKVKDWIYSFNWKACQSCKMSFLLHGWKYEFRILPPKRVNRGYFFYKTRKSSLIWVNCRGVWGKISPIKWFFTQRQKCIRYTQEVYHRPPNILHLPRIWVKVKVPPNAMKMIIFIKLYPYMEKTRVSGDNISTNFLDFPPNFRLRTRF